MTRSKGFVFLAISFAVGVWLASMGWSGIFGTLVILAFGLAGFALSMFAGCRRAAFAGACVCLAAAGALRLHASQSPNEYEPWFGQKIKLEGFVVQDPDLRLDKQFLTIRPKNFNQNILVTANLASPYEYGQWVLLEDVLDRPQNFDDFDYRKYLERQNVFAVMRYPKILVLRDRQLSPAKHALLSVKRLFVARVGRLLPEPQSSLLLGILIGAKKTLPPAVLENFNAVGISHIVAVSGYNITVIIAALAFLARALGRRAALAVSLLLIMSFVVVAGASASVVRAAIMGSLLLLSSNVGRQYAAAPALFFTAFIMLLLNPKILFWDAGFQLSFLATLGIVLLLPPLEEMTASLPNPLGLKTILGTTFSAMAATLPLVMLSFGRLSLAAPLANVMILPALPLTMLLGFLSVLPLAGPGCAFVAGLLLEYILRLTAFFAAMPYASVQVELPAWGAALGYALLLGIWASRYLAAGKAVEK